MNSPATDTHARFPCSPGSFVTGRSLFWAYFPDGEMKALKMEETKLEIKKIVERNKSFILNTHVRVLG